MALPDVDTASIAVDQAVVERAAVARRRLEFLADRLTGSGVLDPALLRELAEFAGGEAFSAAQAYEGVLRAAWGAEAQTLSRCGYGCELRDWRCPKKEPFERVVKGLQAAGYGAHHDPVDQRVAEQAVCVCGRACSYAALERQAHVRSWSVCLSCWHWLEF